MAYIVNKSELLNLVREVVELTGDYDEDVIFWAVEQFVSNKEQYCYPDDPMGFVDFADQVFLECQEVERFNSVPDVTTEAFETFLADSEKPDLGSVVDKVLKYFGP